MINIFDVSAMTGLRKELALNPYLMRGLHNRLLKRFLPDSVAIGDFPEPQHLELHCLELERRCDSEIDGATKLLFRTASGLLIESVILRIASGRTTLCISSQVGCAAACDFCATGRMGFTQNLSAAQMLDQVLPAGQLLTSEQRRLRNIVFMGMGEPFHNEQNLHEVLEIMTDPASLTDLRPACWFRRSAFRKPWCAARIGSRGSIWRSACTVWIRRFANPSFHCR